MNTPIYDFVRAYQASGTARMHMPGHKGQPFLGCEGLDITEIAGADALYEAAGIIKSSEQNAAALFGARRTLYATEGSSQCIRAMLYLALTARPQGTPPLIVAARNVHKAYLYAAALLDFETVWLYPRQSHSLCSCPVDAQALAATLCALPQPPAAVYVTSPDYLGGQADVRALAQVCHQHHTRLLVDNAHGAYLHFLPEPQHPLDLGADLCCDSAHKTLPVLTGGAYLHVADARLCDRARSAMALFGSTSPSYLTLCSLDVCNRYLSADYRLRLAEMCIKIEETRAELRQNGWQTLRSDPLRITLRAQDGQALSQRLRAGGIECEYADPECVVLMLTPENQPDDLQRLVRVLGKNTAPACPERALPLARGAQACSVRQALFAPHETIPAARALGRICGAPTVACPPAIPIAVSGERIEREALALFAHYGIDTVDVLKEEESSPK